MLIFLKILAYAALALKIEVPFVNFVLKYMPDLPQQLREKYKVILVCGSCGKTTTLVQSKAAIEASGCACIGGRGAKSMEEIVAVLLKNYPADKCFAIFEAGSGQLEKITKVITPEAVAVTNIFSDKNPDCDLYADIVNGCKNLKDTVYVLNGDEPMLYDFMEGSRRYFYGFRINPLFPGGNTSDEDGKICNLCNQPYKYIYNTYAHLGNYSCVTCGKTRPQLALGVDRVDSLNERGSEVSFDGLLVNIPLAGGSNIYNALCAATLAAAVGVEPEYIKSGIEEVKSIPGVHETVKIDTKELCLISVGSALDCTESVNSIMPDGGIVYIALLVSREDTQWIDAVPFEKFINLNYHGILIGGEGRRKMTERLESAGLDSAKFMICDDFDSFLYSVRTNVIGKTYVFATKKLMKSLRRNLHKKKYLKKL